MYEAFYGFREKPFNLTPDPKFLYLSGKHNEAFAHLEFGLRQKGGFIVVTGEVGTGKTTLCRYFLERLDENTVSAFILYPALGTTELLRAVNRDLGVANDGKSDKELIDALHEFLLSSRKLGKSIVLVIDEAQNLSRDVLEQVRLISNLETNTEKLIQIVLIGQSELNEKLAQRDLRQLAQRITARYHLNPLSREEMERYIRHRLAVAGGNGMVDFTSAAIRRIHRFSQGIPRLTNLACDRALLAGYVLETSEITPSLVRRVVKELSGETERRSWGRLWRGAAWLAAGLLGLAGLIALAGSGGALDLDGFPWRGGAPRPPVAESRPAVRQAAAPSPIAREDAEERFELRLLTLSPELSPRAASAVLLERWGFHVSGGPASISTLEDMPSLAQRAALQYLELRTNLEQLRALDLPAVLEISPPSGIAPLYVALTGLEGDVAVVSFAPGDEFRLPVATLETFLSGGARLFWRDFDNLEAVGPAGQQAWTRARLATLGMLPGASDESPHQLREAVKELQKKVHLLPDGDVDNATRMALYSLSSGYRVPRLRQP
jgi:general secretion pathway protein A